MSIKKTKRHTLLLSVSAALCLASGALAADVAGNAFDFLRMDAGAAGIAAGGAGAAKPTDAYSVFYNPALNYASGREGFISAGLSYSAWVEGINYQDAAIGRRSGKNAYGINYRRVDYGDINGWDAAGTRTADYTAGAYVLGLDFSRKLSRELVAGVAAKTAGETISGATSRAFLFDLGLFYKPSHPSLDKFTFGLALKNAGGSVRFDAANEILPMILEAGASYKPFADKELALMIDCGIPNTGKPEPRVGVEYSPMKGLFLRAGYSGSDAGSGLRAGAGVALGDISLDYALLPMGDFGITQHLGINFKFDTGRKPAAPPAPVIETQPVVEPKPIEPKPVEQPAAPQPVVESTQPVTVPVPVVEPKPAEQPAAPQPVIESTQPVAAPAPVVEPKPAVELKVTGIKIGKGISGREPLETGNKFDLKVGRVYCWTAVKASPAPVTIKHVWYDSEGKKVITVKLPVESAGNGSWRTWSTTKVYWGKWKVEVTDENGNVLDTITFRVGKP
ncbi:MAG: PorV/PorQ family protein [Elusimicrobia bacterium]|nr:PorV/PorQ family protein [Elusimicrobiota bacterium]